MSIKPTDLARWGLITAALAILAWLLISFVLPWMSPFIAAFLFARLMEPMVKMLCRRGWNREFASGICTLLLLGLVAAAIGALLTRGISEISSISRRLPEMLDSSVGILNGVRQKTGDYMSSLPPEVVAWMNTAIDSLTELFAKLPARMSERLLGFLSSAAAAAPNIFLFTITTGIGIYFISAAYPGIQAFFDTHLPERWQRRRLQFNHNMRFTVGGYVRAQLILMVITFFELLFAFLLLRIEGALVVSIIIAVVDALPIIGAGAMLIPWGVVSLLLGDTATGLGLFVTWGVVTLLRNCIQAKLLGDQLGMHPLITLMAIYVGWCAFGVWGMIIFPMGALLVKQLSDSGVLRLWRTKENEG